MSDNSPVTFEKLYDEYWSNIVYSLSLTAKQLISTYQDGDLSNAAKLKELEGRLSSEFEYYSGRAAELSRMADEMGVSGKINKESAQAALDSIANAMGEYADKVSAQGVGVLSDFDRALSNAATRELLKTAADKLGIAGDVLSVLLNVLEGDYYGAVGGIVAAVAGMVLATTIIGAVGAGLGIGILVVGGYLVGEGYKELLNLLDPLGINSDVNSLYQSALSWLPRSDPLVLDLDGDGIETLPANGTVLFDHDGDGVKNATGWIKSDDGILVLDRNGDGLIDTGAELFGDNTTKADGTKAKNGFDALTDFDSNQDGQVDANDAQFGNLRVWRDLNVDGTSQANELFTLNQLGIASIGTGSTPSSVSVGNNNVAVATGSFTYTNGAVGEVEAAASLNLAENNFYREFTDPLPVPEDKANLPNMQGSGAVRDLREAAANNANLENILTQYSQAVTHEAQMALLDGLIEAWADSADYLDWEERLDAQTYAYETASGGIKQYQLDFYWPWEEMPGEFSTSGGDADGDGNYTLSVPKVLTPEQEVALLKNAEVLERVRVLEVFNAQNFLNFGSSVKEIVDAQQQVTSDAKVSFRIGSINRNYSFYTGFGIANINIQVGDIPLARDQANLINSSYEQLKKSVYEALLTQTRLKPYLDSVSLGVSENGEFELDFAALDSLVQQNYADDRLDTVIDVIELIKMTNGSLVEAGWSAGYEFATRAIGELTDEDRTKLFSVYGNHVTSGSDLIATNVESDSISAGTGNDFVFAGNGKQTIHGDQGNDFLFGGDGEDYIYGDAHEDFLVGGAGNDSLSGGVDVDSLTGGTGNDTLQGGAAADVYHFSLGDGQDSIYDNDSGTLKDRIVLGDGISLDDVRFAVTGSDLVIQYGAQGDQIKVGSYFFAGYYRVEELKVGGTVYEMDALLNRQPLIVLGATTGNDTLTGQEAKGSLLDGGTGDDKLTGGTGNDVLIGGTGNDTLTGNAGSDVLRGGTGNDTLQGGTAADAYHFSLGDGQDSIYENDSVTLMDRIVLGEGISLDDVRFAVTGGDLVILYGTQGDQIKVSNYFNANYYRVEELEVGGTVYEMETLLNRQPLIVLGATTGNDTLTGQEAKGSLLDGGTGDDKLTGGTGNDVLIGGTGNDTLTGNAGNDVLRGGTGNDTLQGGVAADAYHFSLGDGQDSVYDSDSVTLMDRIVLGEGISLDDVRFAVTGGDLVILYGTQGDQIKVSNYFNANYYRVEELEVGGTVYEMETLLNRQPLIVLGATTGNDTLTGQETKGSLLDGGTGDDKLTGGTGNDVLIGGTGNDTLTGNAGNDVLRGGTGNDTLQGGAMVDAYHFSLGDGQDSVYDSDSGALKDRIVLGEGISLDDVRFAVTGGDLVILFGAQGDQIKVSSYFNANYCRVEELEVGGTVYEMETLLNQRPLIVLGATTGNDTLTGQSTKGSLLDGGTGDDKLTGGTGNDVLIGGTGNDTLTGNAGNDVLRGGTGNDTLQGGAMVDAYHFSLGDGQDSVYDSDSGTLKDRIVLGEGISLDDVRFAVTGGDLVIQYGAQGDQIKVSSYFNANYCRVEELEVGGTVYEMETLLNQRPLIVLGATTGNDTLTGQSTKGSLLDGGTGDDKLTGGTGNDVLIGGAGNDTLTGNAGNDVLRGGTGNDTLEGGATVDAYHFSLGDGQDSVYDSDSGTLKDRVVLGEGISLDDVRFAVTGGDLVIQYGAQGDQIKVSSYFNANYCRVEELEVGGTVYEMEALLNLRPLIVLGATTGNDTLTGHSTKGSLLDGGTGDDKLTGGTGNDVLIGGIGNDTLTGNAGNDVLSGGSGNDTLQGGAAADAYHFSLGDGLDSLYENDTTSGALDLARFHGADVDDLWFSRVNSNLIVSRIGTSDQVTIQSWYSSTAYQVETIETDTSVLASTAVNQLVTAMAQFNVSVGAGAVVPQDVWDQLQPTLSEVWQPKQTA